MSGKETSWLSKLPDDAVNLTEQVTAEGGFIVAHNWEPPMLAQLVQRGYKIVFILGYPRTTALSVLDWSYTPSWGGRGLILHNDRQSRRAFD